MEATTRVMSQTTMGFAVLAMLLVPAIGPLDVSGSPLVSWATVGGFLGAQATANWLGHRIDIRRGRERDLPFLIGMAFMNAVVVVAVVSGLLRG